MKLVTIKTKICSFHIETKMQMYSRMRVFFLSFRRSRFSSSAIRKNKFDLNNFQLCFHRSCFEWMRWNLNDTNCYHLCQVGLFELSFLLGFQILKNKKFASNFDFYFEYFFNKTKQSPFYSLSLFDWLESHVNCKLEEDH